jgi:hypothetical protein
VTDAEALDRIKEARRLVNDAYGRICRSGRASEFARELTQLQHIEDVLWQYTTSERREGNGNAL